MWRPITILSVILIAYSSVFIYVICPNVSNESTVIPLPKDNAVDLTLINPFLQFNCKYYKQLNQESGKKLLDHANFWYKIYVKPHISFYQQYYFPKHKLYFDTQVTRLTDYFKYKVNPRLEYGVKKMTHKLSFYFDLFCLQVSKVKLSVTESEVYKVYLEYYVNFIHDVFVKLFENSNLKKFNEQKLFLKNEINKILELNFGKEKIDIDLNELEDYEYDSDSDLEPLTVSITSTIVKTKLDNSVETKTPFENKVDELLFVFETKINKTVNLALINISKEINPVVNKTVDNLQHEVSEKFKSIQNKNYASYKEAYELIKKIDKDLSLVKETNQVVETVSRQEMRDIISEIREFNEKETGDIEQLINEKFGILINQYLSIIQDTIDILESFMDSSFQDFSNKLSSLLSDSNDEEFEWKVWKKFHNLKNLVLDQRDYIFDQANLLKEKKFDEVSLDNDFSNWLSFLGSITFHLNFISRDNDEYLQLIRAQANVSYQAREAAIRDLEKIVNDDKIVNDEKVNEPNIINDDEEEDEEVDVDIDDYESESE